MFSKLIRRIPKATWVIGMSAQIVERQPKSALHANYNWARPRRRLAWHGFTLVELMIVIVIIGLLAGAVTAGVRSYLVAGKQSVAKMEIASICQALETYYSAYDRFPANDEGLEVLSRPSPKFVDGLLNKLPRDPWGRAYQYNHPGRGRPFDVISYGADGREGGSGADKDISSADVER